METTNTNQFGRKIRSIRALIGLSQGEMASILGISKTTLSNYERGIHVPAADLWQSILEMGRNAEEMQSNCWPK